MRLILVRHTRPDLPEGTLYGRSDVPLAESFMDEAMEVDAALRDIDADAVFTSPALRCRMLAGICGHADATVSPLLAETDYGQWEMTPLRYIDPSALHAWTEKWMDTAPPSGETGREHLERVARWIESLKAQGRRRVLAFTHGGTIIHALHLLQGHPYPITPPAYGSITDILT